MAQTAHSHARALERKIAEGKKRRETLPRELHGPWKAHPRRDPTQVLETSNQGRLHRLLPIRYGRMAQSPFAFFRGAAAIMAADLSRTPTTGFEAQLCGDCHLLNFGAFATPERRMIFAINDFDETLRGPWEWDLKRLVASFVIASRHNNFTRPQAREIALACARSYRKRLREFTEMRVLQLWYSSLDVATLAKVIDDKESQLRLRRRLAKVMSRDVVEDDYPVLAKYSGGRHRIRDNPPLIFHPRIQEHPGFQSVVQEAFKQYRLSLLPERRFLLDRYTMQDIAMKVVGVGSVGTWCGILLMMAGDEDPLFLQVKEARPSVLERYLKKSPFPCHGQRVVMGQRLMQSASDIFLGWTQVKNGRHFYVRQLRDMKLKPRVEIYRPGELERYAKFCGLALARAHARSSFEAAGISAYLGKGDTMDQALVNFAESYADQNERDHQALLEAIRMGKIEAYFE